MDNSGTESLTTKSVFGSSWIKKKSRYEDEDIALSPPDDSSFFTLRFGQQQSKPHASMYDRINKELGLSFENTNRGRVTPELNLVPATQATDEHHNKLLFGASGVTLEKSRPHHSSLIELAILNEECASDTPSVPLLPESVCEPKKENRSTSFGLPGSPESSSVARQDVDTLVRKARGGRPTRKISMNLADTFDRSSLLQSVSELSVESPPSLDTFVGAATPSLPSAPPAFTGVVSQVQQRRLRKTSAPPSLNPMLMETQKAANYFFTGSLFAAGSASTSSSQTDLSSKPAAAAGAASELSLKMPMTVSEPCSPVRQLDPPPPGAPLDPMHPSLSRTTSLMDERSAEAASHDPKPRMGKRRPKASSLREMNFWAPQSM